MTRTSTAASAPSTRRKKSKKTADILKSKALKAKMLVGEDKQLTAQQLQFVLHLTQHGMPQSAAARQAGYGAPAVAANALMKMPHIQKAVREQKAKWEAAGQMTKKKVLDGFLKAAEIAEIKADSLALTAAWREIAKLCGYYEATKHKIEVSHNGQVTLQRLQTMSDDELLKLAEGDIIEGEIVGDSRALTQQ